MRMPPVLRSGRCTLSAAGFIATSASSWSPGMYTRWLPNWSWKLETPNSVPAGARISAGKLGSVEMSFPAHAASVVNCSPVTCMPSPESPANRITARVSVRRGFWATAVAAVSLIALAFPFFVRQSACQSSGVHFAGMLQRISGSEVQDRFREQVRHPLDHVRRRHDSDGPPVVVDQRNRPVAGDAHPVHRVGDPVRHG